MKVLIIEDHVRLGRLIGHGVEVRGFHYDLAPSLEYADQALRATSYDAIILDLSLPDGDGLTWLAATRLRTHLPPVIVLTARDDLGDRVAGLDAGADDYLVKPVDIEELAARLRALMRRPGTRAPPVMNVGALVFDAARRTAYSEHIEIDLTRREADLLELLMRRAGTVVRRSTIEDGLYALRDDITPNAVEAVVSRLRHKLHGGTSHRLVTVRGVGYMLREETA